MTGPVVEEVRYRGYLIERVVLLSGRVWVAAGVSWLAFTGVHLGFFGLGATLNAAVLSDRPASAAIGRLRLEGESPASSDALQGPAPDDREPCPPMSGFVCLLRPDRGA